MRRRKPTAEPNRRALAYVRVSTLEQAREGVSLEAQDSRLAAYAQAQGLELVGVIREEGVSAAVPLAARPGAATLLALLAENGAGHVIALKLDRLFRDAADALNVTRAWDKAGVALHLVDMGGSSVSTGSAVGRMLLVMLAGVAELERGLIGERTALALAHKQARGEHVGRPPRGYRIEGKRLAPMKGSEGLRLEQRARALRGRGLSFAKIAAALEAEGFRPERGRRFYDSSVRYILQRSSGSSPVLPA